MPQGFQVHLPFRARRRGFTMIETLVVIGLLIILLSIFIPYLRSIREESRRERCSYNLYTIRDALNNYARANLSEFPRTVADTSPGANGYTAFTGPDDPDPFREGSAVEPNDVTASLWLLVRQGYVIDTGVFTCPSSDDVRDLLTDSQGKVVKPIERGNFRKPASLSYSYASPFSPVPGYRLNDTKRSEFALLADKNPGPVAAQYSADASPVDLANANSRNHGTAGQNVLFANGVVEFVRTPFSGVGRTKDIYNKIVTPGDNIYSAIAPAPTTHPSTQPMAGPAPIVRGYIGYTVSPAHNDDSYLVPTAEDVMQAPARPVTQPASRPTTTLPTTTAPATRPATTLQAAPAPVSRPATTAASRPASTAPVVRPTTRIATPATTRTGPGTAPTTLPAATAPSSTASGAAENPQ